MPHPSTQPASPAPLRLPGLLVAALAVFGFLSWRFAPLVVDDSFITFRYAARLAHGQGLTFNPGERVEGYSNFLWTLLLAGGAALGQDLETCARVLGLACGLAVLLLTWRLAARLWPDAPQWQGVAPLLVAAAPMTAYWAGAGLETPLFALLWLGSRVAVQRQSRVGVGVLLFLLPLCRPDGVLPVATALGLLLWYDRKRWWPVAAAVVGAGLVYAAWKVSYFGDLLPNTWHAKSLPLSTAVQLGARYLWRLLLACPWLLACGVLAMRPKQPANARDLPFLTLLVADALLLCAYLLWVGGDSFPLHRFIVPVLPVLALLAVAGLRRMHAKPTLLVLGAAVSLHPAWLGQDVVSALTADRLARVGQGVGAYLHKHLPVDAVVAVNDAGALPFASQRTAVDMLGLTDRTVARTPVPPDAPLIAGHFHGNGAYVLSRQPAVVQMGNTLGTDRPLYFSDIDLARQPGFKDSYRLWQQPLAQVAPQAAQTQAVGTYLELGEAEKTLVDADNGLLTLCKGASGLVAVCTVFATDAPVRLWLRAGTVLP